MVLFNLPRINKLLKYSEEYGGKNVLKKTFFISFPNRYIYTANAKVASSTIKLTLSHNEYVWKGYNPPESIDINRGKRFRDRYPNPLTCPTELTPEQLNVALSDPMMWRFTFVRNPYDRVVSTYLDKIFKGRKVRLRKALLPFAPSTLKESKNWTFEQFLEVVANQQDAQRNLHWRTQTASIFFGVVKQDYIGKLETFDSDFRKVREELARRNIRNELPELKTYKKHATNSAYKKAIDSDRSRKLVRKIYQEDYDNFGY